MSKADFPETDLLATRYMRAAAVTAGLGVGVVCALLSAAPLPRVLIADGAVSADVVMLPISHGEGGLIVDVAAQPGDVVQAGDLLFRLAPAQGGANTDALRLQAARLALTKARLTALMEGVSPDFSTDQALDPVRARREQREYEIEKALVMRLTRSVDARIARLRLELAALDDQLASLRATATGASAEHRAVTPLGAPPQQITPLDLSVVRARAGVGPLHQQRASVQAALSRAETERAEVMAERRRGWSSELAEVSSALGALDLRLVRHTARITEHEVRAPAGGRVQRVARVAPGELVPAGAALAEILPSDAQLMAEIYVEAQAARQIEIGGAVRARVDGADVVIEGLVRSVSPDLVRTADGRAFRRAHVALAPMVVTEAGAQMALLPGMWITAEIAVNEASLLDDAARALTGLAFGPAHARAP